MLREHIQQQYSPELENLLLILTEIQSFSPDNSISEEDMAWVAEYLNITLSSVYGVVRYYSLFSTKPRGRYVLRICHSPVCTMMGADTVVNDLESLLGVEEGKVSDDGLFSFERVQCLGQCEKAPSMLVNVKVHGKITKPKLKKLLISYSKKI